MNIMVRIWIVSTIGVLFAMGLVVLLVWGRNEGVAPVLACVGLLSYCIWSVNTLRKQLPQK